MDGPTFLKELAPTVSPALNVISILGSSLVLLIAIALRLKKPNLMNRVTLRLQIGISFFDLLTHVFAMFHHIKDGSAAFCTFIGFYRSFGNMVYCFLNIAIALNLQLIFLHNLEPKKYWEIGYWSAIVGLSLLANIPPLALDYFGKNADGLCFFNKDKYYSGLVLNVNINAVMIVSCLYCFVVSAFVIVKLFRNVDVLNQMNTVTNGGASDSRPKLANNLKKLIFRISLYPIVCFLCLSGFIARFIVTETGGNRNTLGLIVWSMVGLTSTGFFNFLAFCCDPTLHIALHALYKEYKYNSLTNTVKNDTTTYDIELHQTSSYNTDNKDGEDKDITPYGFEEMNPEDSKAMGEFMKLL